MHHLVRRGLYCEIQPVFHRPDCRVLFTRIMGEVAMQFFVQFEDLGNLLIRDHTAVVQVNHRAVWHPQLPPAKETLSYVSM